MSTEMHRPRPSRARRRRRAAALLAIALALTLAARTGPAAAAPSATASVPYINFFSQLDPLWGTALVGYHEDVRMRSMGSLLTCIAMVASSYGLLPWFLVPGTPVSGAPSPDYIHVWLKDMHGYRESPPKTVIIDYNIGWAFQDAAGTPVALEFLPFDASQLELVDTRLDKGEPTILYMKREENRFHPVVVVGWDPTTVSYLVLDPADRWSNGYPRSLLHAYGLNWATMVAGGLLPVLSLPDEPEEDPNPYPLLSASTKSPVELTAVDPDGRRLGWDPATGSVILDVPGATYLPQPVWADPTRLLPDRPPGRLLTVPGARQGRYRFQMIATGDGPFTLSVRAYGKDHARLVEDSVIGTVATGDVLKFQVEYSETGPSGFTVGDNFDPEANAGGAQAAIVGTGVAFAAFASFDIDGTIASYAWDFGDGATATGPDPAHEYAATGTYTATLTVTDDKGATDTDTALISIYPDQIVEGTTERVSLSPWNTEGFGNVGSFKPAMSGDGRFVVFQSFAENFGGTTEPAIFVRDRLLGTTEQVNETACSNPSKPVVTPDGRFIAYRCNLSVVETASAIVVTDRSTGTHERVDVSPTGAPGACNDTSYCFSYRPAISDDGRFVAFVSEYENLVPGDTNESTDVFVRDRQTATTERVSVSDSGAQSANGAATGRDSGIGISADGRFVAFASGSTDLVPGVQFLAARVYVRDRLEQRTELVSVRSDGSFGWTTGGLAPSISADGRFVAFESASNDLVPNDTNGVNDVFVHDRDTGTTERVSITGAGAQATCSPFESSGCTHDPTISRDGRVVAFRSRATNLVFGDTNNREDVFVRDREAGTTELVSKSSDGELGNGASGQGGSQNDETVIALSADGRFVAFCSDATNLIPYPSDGNGIEDIFVRDRQAAGLVADPSGPYLGWASSATSPATVAFDASRSLHPMGQPMTGLWDFGDGSPIVEAPTYAVATHEYAAPGTYTVTLVVTDGGHSSPPAVTTAEVLPARAESLTLTPACGDPGTAVVATADGQPLVRPDQGWNLGAGPLPGVRSAHPEDYVHVRITEPGGGTSHDFVPIDAYSAPSRLEFATQFVFTVAGPPPGTYTVTLPNEGGDGASAAFTIPCPPVGNEPPQAAVGGPYEGNVGLPVLFDGIDSVDPEGAPLTYQWYFEDGGTATGPLPAHTFDAPGEYWVLLIVNDGELDSPTSVDTGSYATVTIGEAPPTGECGSVPNGPTYDSVECRVLAARATTLESATASRMRNRMIVELDMARKRLDDSRGFCAAGNVRKAKARVRAMRSWIDAYSRRMKSGQAKTLVPAAVRSDLVQTAAGIRTHVNAMARGLSCPGDAGGAR